MSYSVIGGADGPTSVYLAGNFGWLNGAGLIIIILLLIPNIIYALKGRNPAGRYSGSKVMCVLEQTGRYASMFFMVFHIGIGESGFCSAGAILFYGIGNSVLLLLYWIVWMLYFCEHTFRKEVALAIIPVCIFVLSGVTSGNILLVAGGVIFDIGHLYVICQNAKA